MKKLGPEPIAVLRGKPSSFALSLGSEERVDAKLPTAGRFRECSVLRRQTPIEPLHLPMSSISPWKIFRLGKVRKIYIFYGDRR